MIIQESRNTPVTWFTPREAAFSADYIKSHAKAYPEHSTPLTGLAEKIFEARIRASKQHVPWPKAILLHFPVTPIEHFALQDLGAAERRFAVDALGKELHTIHLPISDELLDLTGRIAVAAAAFEQGKLANFATYMQTYVTDIVESHPKFTSEQCLANGPALYRRILETWQVASTVGAAIQNYFEL